MSEERNEDKRKERVFYAKHVQNEPEVNQKGRSEGENQPPRQTRKEEKTIGNAKPEVDFVDECLEKQSEQRKVKRKKEKAKEGDGREEKKREEEVNDGMQRRLAEFKKMK